MVLSREEADRRLARIEAEHEAIESSLLALHDHAGRRLLEGAELAGATRRRWTRAERRTTLLWRCFEVCGTALERAREIRSRRRVLASADLDELTRLLEDQSLVLSGGDLLAEHVSWDQLVQRMNADYADVLDVVAAADAVWSALPARIDLLTAELRRLTALAGPVGVRPGEHPAGDELECVTAELAALRAEVIADPLAFWQPGAGSAGPGRGLPDTGRYDRAARAIEDIRREVDAVIAVRRDADQRLARLRDVLSRADRTLAEARAARVEVLAKIAASEVPAVTGAPAALQEELSSAAEYRRRGLWHRLSPLLESLEPRAEAELERARGSLTAVTAPLAVRAELRGRLDAYRAKAAGLGPGADPGLAERYDAARRMLWSAPCDLGAAERAVLRYQRAIAEALIPRQERPRRPSGTSGTAGAAGPADRAPGGVAGGSAP